MELQIRLLSLEETEKIYYTHMKTDFARNELRPFAMIKNLFHKGFYYIYGIFENEELRAYAFLLENLETQILLFDYFAVCKEYRSKGYGTKALELVFGVCKDRAGIILEVENPEAVQDETEKNIRKRRIAFYERCGIQMSEVRTWLFGVDYCMMFKVLSDRNISSRIVETLEQLYRKLLPGPMFKKMFHIV